MNTILSPETVHVMLDLETWGTCGKVAVSTVGAVAFCEAWPVNVRPIQCFSNAVSLESALLAGLEVDAETVKWWRGQQAEAQLAMATVARRPLEYVVADFALWWATVVTLPGGREVMLWGNGAAADPVWWETACRAVGKVPPWKHYEVGCFRTLRGLCRAVMPAGPAQDAGGRHVALLDAKHQMEELRRMIGFLRGELLVRPAVSLESPAAGLPVEELFAEMREEVAAALDAPVVVKVAEEAGPVVHRGCKDG